MSGAKTLSFGTRNFLLLETLVTSLPYTINREYTQHLVPVIYFDEELFEKSHGRKKCNRLALHLTNHFQSKFVIQALILNALNIIITVYL